MMHNKRPLIGVIGAAILLSIGAAEALADPLLIVGIDEKVRFDEKGSPVLSLPGKDPIVILDLADPEAPKIVASLPLKNSVVGPPVNVAIDPTNSIALVADSVDVKQEGDKLVQSPDNKLLRHRSEGFAQARRHSDARQAALGAELQSCRQPRPGRQSGRQVDRGAVGKGHRRSS